MLAQDTTGEAFRYAMLGNDPVDTRPPASRAHNFTGAALRGPEAASFRISFSRVRSGIARWRRGSRSPGTSAA